MDKKFSRFMQKQNKRPNHSPLFVVAFVLLIIYLVVLLVPLLYGILFSFVTRSAYSTFKAQGTFPTAYDFSNYYNGFKYFEMKDTSENVYNFWGVFGNTILYAGGCALFATATPFVVSYLISRFDFKFSKFIYGLVLVVMAIPIVGNMPSEITVAQTLGLYDSIWGMWIMRMHFIGIYFLVFYAIFKNIPMDYTEAAKIDGAGNFRIMLRVIFPLAIGTFGIVFLLNFITFWNDYQVPNFYLPNHPVLGYSIFFFANNPGALTYEYVLPSGKTIVIHGGAGNTQLFAMIILCTIPIVLLAIIFNKKLMGNLTDGGVKE